MFNVYISEKTVSITCIGKYSHTLALYCTNLHGYVTPTA